MAEGLTKKQIKELRKLEKMQERNLAQKSSSVKWVAIAVASVLFLVLFVGIVLIAKEKKNPETTAEKIEFSKSGHERMERTKNLEATNSADNAQNAVSIVEFADLQCPACRTFHPTVVELLKTYPDRVKVTYKHFPLVAIHKNAMAAAIAAEAAGRQNKFFEFVDMAYEKQASWSELSDPQPQFEIIAKAINLDLEQFKKDQKDPDIEKIVNEERNEGIKNGVSGTPTFFIEGKRIQNPSNIDEFKKLIKPYLSVKPSADQNTTPTAIPSGLPLQ